MSSGQPGGDRQPLTAAQRTRRARIASLISWSRTTDRAARARPGAAGLLARFEVQVDPGGVLGEDHRRELALLARRAHMLQLAERSAATRRRKAASRASPPQPD